MHIRKEQFKVLMLTKSPKFSNKDISKIHIVLLYSTKKE